LVSGLKTPWGRDDDGTTVLDVGPEAHQPVRAGALESIEVQDSFAGEHSGGDFISLERSVELPCLVRRIKIVRRDKNLESLVLRSLEDAYHVLDGIVFLKTLADERPSEAAFI
jgi:hypothetical protein